MHLATALPHLTWQPTDQGEYFAGLVENIERLAPLNVSPPLYLDIATSDFPPTDHIYAANVVHIMPAALLAPLFRGAASAMPRGGKLCFYGPFKYLGEFTADSNATFDEWLKARNPLSGIRDIETLQASAQSQGFRLMSDTPMPANNQLLVFTKQ